jgi:hypothetical protein
MKIFVSSTYTDLVEYRKAVERAINLLDQQFKGMGYFGARPEEPKTACLKEIEQADIFVGIYAHRYGFIPEGDTKSITEQEFDHAQKLGKPIFCYRVNADFPWSPKFIERGDAERKLAAFIARIETDFVRQEFTTPEDLPAKISPDLSRYLAAHGAVALITHPLPPVAYFVHTYPLQAHFTGRKNERADLSDWLGRVVRSVLVLEAIGGMGKSALALGVDGGSFFARNSCSGCFLAEFLRRARPGSFPRKSHRVRERWQDRPQADFLRPRPRRCAGESFAAIAFLASPRRI